MKKFVIIALLFFGLIVVSCQKEDVRPNEASMNVPVWQDDSGASAKSGGSDETVIDGGGSSDGGDITDPDEEEDASVNKNTKKGN